MPVKMAPHQLEFYRELLAPFASHELSEVPARGGKKTLTYLDKRALENRLDSVCGPHGWYPEYEATNRGYKCRLHILVPTAREETWVWHHKEDGAGFEEMGSTNKATGEFEYDVDNDEKSGYTNALRRAAQDAWGIGRYLYNKGIPGFLDPNARPLAPAPAQATRSEPAQTEHETTTVRPIDGSDRPAPAPAVNGQKPYDNFKIPPPGKSVFAWCKEMEKTFDTKLVDGMGREGENRGWGKLFGSWDADQVREVCMTAIGFIRSLPTYKGQFEHLFQGQPNHTQAASAPNKVDTPPPGSAGTNIADLRRDLMNHMQALVERQIGRKAEPAELKAALANIASECQNGEGHTGECPESLAKCADAVWIRNMITFTKAQIAQSAQAGDNGSDDIPF